MINKVFKIVSLIMFGLILGLFLVISASGTDVLTRVSIDENGYQVSHDSYYSIISGDGRYVAFTSRVSNFVPEDTSDKTDIFLKDIYTGAVTRVSYDSEGGGGGIRGWPNDVSDDGRYVVFTSEARNLVSGDTNERVDVFLKDMHTGQTTRVSTDSANGQGNNESTGFNSSISANGRYVVFGSRASNLVLGDSPRGLHEVYRKDMQTGQTIRVSTDSAGANVPSSWGSEYPSISADGRFVAFESDSSTLATGDINITSDIFIKDMQSGQTTIVSTDSAGWVQDGYCIYSNISADGRYVSFASRGGLVPEKLGAKMDIFVKDLQTGHTSRVSTDSSGGQGNGVSSWNSISANGRFVAFDSTSSNLAPGDTNGHTDVFVKDTLTGQTAMLSQGNDESYYPSVSADGRRVAFYSSSTNLVPGDINGSYDVFVAALACSGTKPDLSLSKGTVHWASYADYLARELTVQTIFSNNGSDTAYGVTMTGATCTNGVTLSSPVPFNMGDLVSGASAEFGVRYHIPVGVGSFRTNVTGSATDACGTTYLYP